MGFFGSRISRPVLMLSLFATTVWTGQATAAQLALNWTDTSNNEDGFKIERKAGTTGTFAQIATTGVNVASYADSSVTGGATYCYRVRAYNTAGDSSYTNEACGIASADTQVPVVSLTAPSNGATVSGSAVTVSASASDNSGVAGVQFLLDGNNLGSEDTTSPYSILWNTTTAANGSHTLTARARDAAGNQATATTVTVTVNNQAPPPSTGGLVAAYGFDEGSGVAVADASGNNNGGAVYGASWTTQGKFGSALSFTGNSWVAVNDAPSLDLTTGMTLEAWVYPTVTPTNWSTVIMKQDPSEFAYTLYAGSPGNRPYVIIQSGNHKQAQGSAALPVNSWSHLAGTYDGATLRLYVNGAQVGSLAYTGSIVTSGNPLTIGRNNVWGEYFTGRIDEVRIYNRALSASEIQTDMNTPIAAPPPSTTYALTITKAGAGSGSVNSSPAGINCGSTCTASYTNRTAVTLTATPASGSIFAGWSGDADCSDGSVTMTAAKTCTATFTLQSYALTVAKAGTGSGTVSSSPAGVDCGTICSTIYTAGAIITLAATPASGSIFAGWSGDADCSDGSVTMTAAKTCTATFNLAPATTYSLTVSKTGSGKGTVTSSPSGINCGSDCAEVYTANTSVTLTATPAAGSIFAGWSGHTDCTDGSVTMTAAKTCTATFLTAGVRIGIYRPSTGQWFLDVNGNGTMDDCGLSGCVAPFGESEKLPVVGDWDGTGTTKLGVFNPNTRMWKLDRNGDDAWVSGIDLNVGPFGQVGDLPVVGDWDGSGITKLGVKRPTKARWELDLNGNGKWDGCTVDLCGSWGGTVQPVVGDWNGLSDGAAKDMIGFFLPGSTTQWKLDMNDNRAWNSGVDLLIKGFGQAGDLPVVGDWDGSGATKIGVFDPVTGLWELDSNGDGKWDGCAVDTCLGPFGQSGDLPVVGKW